MQLESVSKEERTLGVEELRWAVRDGWTIDFYSIAIDCGANLSYLTPG